MIPHITNRQPVDLAHPFSRASQISTPPRWIPFLGTIFHAGIAGPAACPCRTNRVAVDLLVTIRTRGIDGFIHNIFDQLETGR